MNLKLVIILSIIIFIIYQQFTIKNSKTENFISLDKIDILQSCKDITPSKLVTVLGGNLQIIKDIFLKNKISPDLISKPEAYPKIASYLVKNGYLQQNCIST